MLIDDTRAPADHPDHDGGDYYDVPLTIYIPQAVYDNIVDVSDDNGQSPDETVLTALNNMFARARVITPEYINLHPSWLEFIKLSSGQTVAQAIGPVKSARIEVLR